MGATRSGSADPGGTDAREQARGHGGFAQQCTGPAWASAATWGQPSRQGTQNRDFMDNWTVHVTISSPGESQGTPGTALGLASWM